MTRTRQFEVALATSGVSVSFSPRRPGLSLPH